MNNLELSESIKELKKSSKKLVKRISEKENTKVKKFTINKLRNILRGLKNIVGIQMIIIFTFSTLSSFSMLHSQKSGLSICLYTRPDLLKNDTHLKPHRCNAVKVQAPPNMMIIIHEGLYYDDAKTRKFPNLS